MIDECMSPARLAGLMKLQEQIEAGNSPLDRVERFCREHQIFEFDEFMFIAKQINPELYAWATKPGKGADGRIRGIHARINVVRRDYGMKTIWR